MSQNVGTDGPELILIMSIAHRKHHIGVFMAKMYIGTYSAAALKGFVTNPTQDRNRLLKQ